MGDLTGEDWYVEHWLRQAAPRTGSAADRVRQPPTLAQREAEQVWYFARCDIDHLELTSLENRLYYGPVDAASPFLQPSPGGPVQFNMELYGEHHSALFSLHDGRLDVLNQLPEREPLDSFVLQLNESLERNGRHLVEVTEIAGGLRIVKSPAQQQLNESANRRRVVMLAGLAVAAIALTAGLLGWWTMRGDDAATEASVPSGPLRAGLTANPSADCVLGTTRIDTAIEVTDVTLADSGGTGILTVQLMGAPFNRFSTNVTVIVPEDPVPQVQSANALSYLFLPGQRWEHEVHGNTITTRSFINAAGGAVTSGASPDVVVDTDAEGRQSVRFTIADFPAVRPGFESSLIVVTSGILVDNGGVAPETCTANLVTVTRR